MPLVLHNTLTRKKEPFTPLRPNRVGMYVCGPTVYDRIHIGNARPLIVFDVLFRLLRHLYGEANVTYVRNITDIDDKIIERAAERGIPIGRLTEETSAAFHADATALGCLPPIHEPRATQHLPAMIALIEKLVANGAAYAADGHVLFHVPSLPAYGRLSGRDRDEQIAGARVEVAPYKRDPADFVLWKPSTADQPGWDSPWGRGRPGWHIECSAMAEALLGVPFDIHGGGIDLIFPHHENEIAQSCAAHRISTFARVWLHNGFVTVNGEKMAKSLGNFTTVADALAKAPGEAIRLWTLGTHYRAPLDWTAGGLARAKATLDRWYTSLDQSGDYRTNPSEPDRSVLDALADDLNTPKALAALFELMGEVNRAAAGSPERTRAAARFAASAAVLGLARVPPGSWLRDPGGAIDTAWVEDRIAARAAARKARDFARADAVRDELLHAGILLEDRPGGVTEWRRA